MSSPTFHSASLSFEGDTLEHPLTIFCGLNPARLFSASQKFWTSVGEKDQLIINWQKEVLFGLIKYAKAVYLKHLEEAQLSTDFTPVFPGWVFIPSQVSLLSLLKKQVDITWRAEDFVRLFGSLLLYSSICAIHNPNTITLSDLLLLKCKEYTEWPIVLFVKIWRASVSQGLVPWLTNYQHKLKEMTIQLPPPPSPTLPPPSPDLCLCPLHHDPICKLCKKPNPLAPDRDEENGIEVVEYTAPSLPTRGATSSRGRGRGRGKGRVSTRAKGKRKGKGKESLDDMTSSQPFSTCETPCYKERMKNNWDPITNGFSLRILPVQLFLMMDVAPELWSFLPTSIHKQGSFPLLDIQEFTAWNIHPLNSARDHPFVCLNKPAGQITTTVLSELFSPLDQPIWNDDTFASQRSQRASYRFFQRINGNHYVNIDSKIFKPDDVSKRGTHERTPSAIVEGVLQTFQNWKNLLPDKGMIRLYLHPTTLQHAYLFLFYLSLCYWGEHNQKLFSDKSFQFSLLKQIRQELVEMSQLYKSILYWNVKLTKPKQYDFFLYTRDEEEEDDEEEENDKDKTRLFHHLHWCPFGYLKKDSFEYLRRDYVKTKLIKDKEDANSNDFMFNTDFHILSHALLFGRDNRERFDRTAESCLWTRHLVSSPISYPVTENTQIDDPHQFRKDRSNRLYRYFYAPGIYPWINDSPLYRRIPQNTKARAKKLLRDKHPTIDIHPRVEHFHLDCICKNEDEIRPSLATCPTPPSLPKSSSYATIWEYFYLFVYYPLQRKHVAGKGLLGMGPRQLSSARKAPRRVPKHTSDSSSSEEEEEEKEEVKHTTFDQLFDQHVCNRDRCFYTVNKRCLASHCCSIDIMYTSKNKEVHSPLPHLPASMFDKKNEFPDDHYPDCIPNVMAVLSYECFFLCHPELFPSYAWYTYMRERGRLDQGPLIMDIAWYVSEYTTEAKEEADTKAPEEEEEEENKEDIIVEIQPRKSPPTTRKRKRDMITDENMLQRASTSLLTQGEYNELIEQCELLADASIPLNKGELPSPFALGSILTLLQKKNGSFTQEHRDRLARTVELVKAYTSQRESTDETKKARMIFYLLHNFVYSGS